MFETCQSQLIFVPEITINGPLGESCDFFNVRKRSAPISLFIKYRGHLADDELAGALCFADQIHIAKIYRSVYLSKQAMM